MELKSKAAFCGGFYEEKSRVFLSGNNNIPDPHFNRVSIISTGLDGGVLDEAVRKFAEGMPIFVDLLHPVPEAARELLQNLGFQTTGEIRSSMMFRKRQNPGRRIEELSMEIVTPATLSTFLEQFLRGFHTPEEVIPLAKALFEDLVAKHGFSETIRMYLGSFRGEPSCTQYLFYENGEGGINMVSTKESLRGRGLASAMIQRLIEDAQELGIERLSLETRADSPPERLYTKLGFATIARHEIFTNTPDLKYGL